MAHNILQPTEAEIDTAEAVICDWLDQPIDGHYRSLGVEVLERTKETRLAQFVAEPGRLRAVDTPRDHSIAAEHYSQVAADARFDAALGGERR
jgi:hypothetical protein